MQKAFTAITEATHSVAKHAGIVRLMRTSIGLQMAPYFIRSIVGATRLEQRQG